MMISSLFCSTTLATTGQNVWATGMGIACIALGLPYDDWKARDKIKVDKKILSLYTGEYKRSNKSMLKIKLKEDRLYCTIPGVGDLPLLAENETTFYLKDFNSQFQFIMNLKGEVSNMIVHEHGQDYSYLRK
jgi:hypothetical protein